MFDLTTILNWLCWTFGVTIALLGIVLALRTLVGWRPPNARRCPSCWYDLSTASTPTVDTPATCPECARAVTSERALTRRRRPRGLIIAGLVITLAGRTLWSVPDARVHGWPRLIPTTTIAFASPVLISAWLNGPNWEDSAVARYAARVVQDFLNRDDEGGVWGWQSDVFARMTAAGAGIRGRAGVGPDGDVLNRLESARLRADLKATPTQLYDAFTAATGVEVMTSPEIAARPAAPTVEVRWRNAPASVAFAMIGSGDYGTYKLWRVRAGALTSAPEASHTDPEPANRVGVYHTDGVPLDRATLLQVITSIASDGWADNGGDDAHLCFCGRWVIINAPPSTLWQVERLLSQIRAAAAHPGELPAQLVAARRAFATLVSIRATPHEPLNAGILALAEILDSRSVPVSLDASAHFANQVGSAEPRPPGTAVDALDAIAAARHGTWIDLTWDLVGDGVAIVDKDLRPAFATTIAYSIADLAGTDYSTSAKRVNGDPASPGVALLASIRENIDPEHWQEMGGEIGWMRAAGGVLVVHTTLRNHVAIDALLARAHQGPPSTTGL